MGGCSLEPEIDEDKVALQTIVMCQLGTSEREVLEPDSVVQWLTIQSVRSIVDLAFRSGEEIIFGLAGAEVRIHSNDTTYDFVDLDNGMYVWTGMKNFVVSGNLYSLDITLADGREIGHEAIAPGINFPVLQDTIWVFPDTVNIWTDMYQNDPVAVGGPHYYHSIEYELTPGAVLAGARDRWLIRSDFLWDYTVPSHNPEPLIYHFWARYESTPSEIRIYTATDSLEMFTDNFSPVGINFKYYVTDPAAHDFLQLMTEENQPYEKLVEFSNINGALGIFCFRSVSISKPYTIAVPAVLPPIAKHHEP